MVSKCGWSSSRWTVETSVRVERIAVCRSDGAGHLDPKPFPHPGDFPWHYLPCNPMEEFIVLLKWKNTAPTIRWPAVIRCKDGDA